MKRPPPGYVNGVKREGDRYRLRIWARGRLYRDTFPTRIEAENARDYLRARARAEGLGIPIPNAPLPPFTLGRVFDEYLRELVALRRAKVSVWNVRRVRRLFCGGPVRDRTGRVVAAWAPGAFHDGYPGALTRRDLVLFVEWCREHSRSRGNLIRSAIGIVRTAMKSAGLSVPPAPAIEYDRKPRRIVSPGKLRAFLAAMPPGSVERTLCELILRTGCRQAEAFRLEVRDVDLEHGVLVLRHRKGRQGARHRQEEHPVSPALRTVLEAYSATLPPLGPEEPFLGVVGSRPRGTRPRRHGLEAFSISSRFEAPARAAEIHPVHGVGWLRNQTATMAGEREVPIEVTRRVLGHTTSAVTERHYERSKRWKAREEFARVIDEEVPLVGYGSRTVVPGTPVTTPKIVSLPERQKHAKSGPGK